MVSNGSGAEALESVIQVYERPMFRLLLGKGVIFMQYLKEKRDSSTLPRIVAIESCMTLLERFLIYEQA